MKCSLTFITKACPRNCLYCDIASSSVSNEELQVGLWIDAFKILKEIGVTFNLILGNESWLLGDRLIQIMEHNKVPYAMYTTAPEKLFDKWYDKFFQGPIDNLSCGIDYPLSYLLQEQGWANDMKQKSLDGWFALIKTRTKYPHVDTQGNITVHRKNYSLLHQTVKELKVFNIFTGINFIHYNKDGLYDFFPSKKELAGFLFNSPKHLKNLHQVLSETLSSPHLIQHPEILTIEPANLKYITDMEWHCGGDPYGGPTIQSDGTLRCCGYRPGKQSPRFSIFDLTNKSAIEEWRWAVKTDAMNCPGCSWSYPRMYHYWSSMDSKFGEQIFTKHAGKHIPKDKWSERKVT